MKTSFDRVSQRVYALYREKRFEDALRLLDAEGSALVGHRATEEFWRACLLAVSGRGDQAIAILGSGLDQGRWWSPAILQWDPDLESIRDRTEFQVLVERSARLMRETGRAPEPVLRILEPDRPTGPLLIVLHGASGTAEEFARHWGVAATTGVTVAVPQSPYPTTSDGAGHGFSWPEPGVEDEVGATVDRLHTSHEIDPERILLGGFSQGGRIAVEIALRGFPISVRGVISVAAGLAWVHDLELLMPSAVERSTRFWFLTGDQDHSRLAIATVHQALEAQGVASVMTMESGLGHAFPDDFETRVREALDFVLDPSSLR